jgi:hypothetical protein
MQNSSGPPSEDTEPDLCGHFGFSFAASQTGAYIADARRVFENKGLGKSIKCAKTIIGVADSLADRRGLEGFDRPVSQVLEVVPLNDPTNLGVGDSLAVRILFKGCPLPGACLTVMPRGKVLPRFGVENPYDTLTDEEGKAGFTFEEPGYHLLVVHLEVEGPATVGVPGVRRTRYTGDLTVMVRPKPQGMGYCAAARATA